MKIEEILKGIDIVSIKGTKDRIVSGIDFDSRKVKKDSMFMQPNRRKEVIN